MALAGELFSMLNNTDENETGWQLENNGAKLNSNLEFNLFISKFKTSEIFTEKAFFLSLSRRIIQDRSRHYCF